MRRTREQWATLVGAFERGSEPKGQFCARRGLYAKTFAWWRWQLRKNEPGAGRSQGVKLLSVDVVDGAGLSSQGAALVIAVSGVEVRVEVGADVGYVAALVTRLRGA